MTRSEYKPLFPYFGGKSSVARHVWRALGNVPNYVEPFFGSGAVLFLRPRVGGTETVNDADGLLANFWRAVQKDPDTVAEYADNPVNECDLHARHLWLVGKKDAITDRLCGDPDFFDAKAAGFWCWGLCCWIGGGWCSGEWKRDVAMRWAAEQVGWKARGVDNWIGISWDEKGRRRAPRRQWVHPVYPLLDWITMHVSGCLAAIEKQGWPEPPRSRCRFCPNQSDAEWLELSPRELELAAQTEDEIRAVDPHAWLHKSMIPLRQVTFDESDNARSGGCAAGMCF